jgi:exosortase D (VPLPA-CTERM-specific)
VLAVIEISYLKVSMQFSIKQVWKPILVVFVLAFLYAVVLTKLGKDWWTDENYSHGLLIPFVIGYIVWLEFDKLKKAFENPQTWLGFSIIILAILMLLAGTLGAELFVQRISLIVILVGIVIYFFGVKLLKLLIVPFTLLLLAIPIPQIIFNKIAFPLQIWASQLAIFGIRVFGVPSVREGNVIELLPRGAMEVARLEVVEACSGIRSLMTLVTLALVFWYFTKDKRKFEWLRVLVLMFSAIPIAILTNSARVTLTAILTYNYGKQTAETWHEISGWLVYIVALILLWFVNFVFKKFQSREQLVENQEAETPSFTLVVLKFPTIWLVAATIFLSAFFINWFETRGEIEVSRKPLKELSATLGDWKQKGGDIRFSEQTESVLRTSDYVMREYSLLDGRYANLYVGYYASQRSGATYHSPQNCLPGSGWEMKQPELVEIKNGEKSFMANRYIIQNGNVRHVLVYWYQGRGKTNASEYTDKIDTVLDGIMRNRSDGAMVRIMIPINSSESEALQSAVDLSSQLAAKLSEFVPE